MNRTVIFAGKYLLIFTTLLVSHSFAETPYVLNFDGVELQLADGREVIDLGEISQGSAASVAITLHNRSTIPLSVVNVRSSCGLSIPAWPRQPIEPGGEARIQLRYDSTRPGPINRILTIHANTYHSTTHLSVQGIVIIP